MRKIYIGWKRNLLVGFHACVAMVAVVIVTGLVFWMASGFGNWNLGDERAGDFSLWEWLVIIVISLPLLGCLIANGPERWPRYPTERGEVRNGRWRKGDFRRTKE